MKLCWNAIVKNEGDRLVRAAKSVAPYIDSWIIVDTGSTDDTKQKLLDFFKEKGITGEFRDEPFVDFSQARNAALSWARKLRFAYQWDYLLLMDADMELVVRDPEKFMHLKDGPSWDMYQVAGVTHYQNRRLLHWTEAQGYLGVTHEYLNVPSAGLIPEEVAFFNDNADGANRPDKYERDIKLLRSGLKAEPDNARYMYYLASTYRDAGQHVKAAKWFARRVEVGGWDEEVWSAQLNYAHMLKALGDDAGFIRNALVAYNMRPSRAEAMYDLAHHFRESKDQQPAALACAEAVEHLPKSTDALFVNDFVYEAGLKEEISICSFYVPGKRAKGFKVTDELSLQAGPYWWSRELARNNIYHYIEPLSQICPSFRSYPLNVALDVGWTAMNPSITVHEGKMVCNVRFVNYKIDHNGAYLIRGTDGTANRENPINTRNLLVPVDDHMHAGAPIAELLPHGITPVEFPLVIGFEDVRLNSVAGALIGSATVRQFHADGNCEQARMHIDAEGKFHWVRMLREPRETEKNWAPIQGIREFMWRPGAVVDDKGEPVRAYATGKTTGHISGGSQLIPYRHPRTFRPAWLAVVHEARPLPGESYKRYYYHRFVLYDEDFRLSMMSAPFVFHDKTIEFCAGMCHHPLNHATFVLSYGVKDEAARLATIDVTDVERLLWLHS